MTSRSAARRASSGPAKWPSERKQGEWIDRLVAAIRLGRFLADGRMAPVGLGGVLFGRLVTTIGLDRMLAADVVMPVELGFVRMLAADVVMPVELGFVPGAVLGRHV